MLKVAAMMGLLLWLGLSGANSAALELTDPYRWVVIASRPDQVTAVDYARNFARRISGIRVVRSINGLHAIIFGPVIARTMPEVRAKLLGRSDLPSDAFLAKGDRFVELEYTAPASPIVAYGNFDGKAPVTVRYGNMTIILGAVKVEGSSPIPTLKLAVGGSTPFNASIRSTNAGHLYSRLQILQLDSKTDKPQVVFTTSTGGAHCCEITQILTAPDGQTWRLVEAQVLDGGYEFEDVDGDGSIEFISRDNSFHYKYESYAGSYTPPQIHRLIGTSVLEVTREASIRPYIEREARQMEFGARADLSLWSNNGYLGGWVATKSLLGQVEDAWSRMLLTYDRNPTFYDEECLIAVKIEQCPADRKRRLPFPEALRNHLRAQGYPLPVGFTPTPAITKGAPLPQPPPAREPPSPTVAATSGSSFFITAEGHLLTNAHVVSGCRTITVSYGAGEVRAGRAIARDETNDLAILKIDASPPGFASFRSGIRLGESIAVYGFPLSGLLASGGNFTLGNITALSGLRDDSRILQISAPVQPGNSGGPLLDETGAVVGIVVSKLNALRLALATSDLAQNVNFAIKAAAALAFAETHGLKIRSAVAGGRPLRPADLADLAKAMTALVECNS